MKVDEKVKFYERSEDLKKVEAGLEHVRQRLQVILDAWHQITDAPLTVDQITGFTRMNHLGARLPDPGKILKAVMIETVKKSPLFGEINVDNLIAMQSKQPDITGLVDAVSGLSDNIPGPLSDPTDQYKPHCFKIDGAVVKYVDSEVEQVKSMYISFAVNTEERHRLALVQKVIDAYNIIRAEYPIPLQKAAFGGMIIFDAIHDQLQPDPYFVKDGRMPTGFLAGMVSQKQQTTAPLTVGDIRSHVPHNTGIADGEAAAARKSAERRNTVTI